MNGTGVRLGVRVRLLVRLVSDSSGCAVGEAAKDRRKRLRRRELVSHQSEVFSHQSRSSVNDDRLATDGWPTDDCYQCVFHPARCRSRSLNAASLIATSRDGHSVEKICAPS